MSYQANHNQLANDALTIPNTKSLPVFSIDRVYRACNFLYHMPVYASIYLSGEPRFDGRIEISTGGEGFDITSTSQIDGEVQLDSNPQSDTTDTSAPAAEDRPIPLSENLSEAGALWNEILVAIIVVSGAIVTYFIIRYFLNRAADSLHFERGQLKGI